MHPRIGTGKKHPPVAGTHAELDAWDNDLGRKIKEAQSAKTKEAHNSKVDVTDAMVCETDTEVGRTEAKVGRAEAKVGDADAKADDEVGEAGRR